MKLSHTLLICACLVFAGMNFSNAVTPAPAPQQQSRLEALRTRRNTVTPAPAPQQQVQKWEYLTVQRSYGSGWEYKASYGNGDDAPYGGLGWRGKAGNDGWELIIVERTDVNSTIYYFKRPNN